MVVVHQPADHLVERALVGHVELLGIMRTQLFRIAAHRSARPARYLAHAVLQRMGTHLFPLTRGDDHPGIGNGDADKRDYLLEHLVGDAVVEHVGVDVHRGLHARDADGVRPHAMHRLQMLGMHDKPRELVAVSLQAEEHAQTHVVDAAFHGTVHGLGVPVVVALGAGGVKLLVALLVVRFLEQDIGTDLGLLQHAVLVYRGGRDVHVHAADGPVLVLDGVDGFHALQDVLDGIALGVFARLDGKALVPHVLQGYHLCTDFLLRELLARNGAVLRVVWAVQATVHAIVRKVQGREQHDAVAVIGQLDLTRQLADFPVDLRIFACQQHRGLAMRDNRAMIPGRVQVGARLLQDGPAKLQIVFVGIGIGQGLEYLCVVDELVGAKRFRVVSVIRHGLFFQKCPS